MKHLYNARDYFKSALLPNYSGLHSDSLGFISESYFDKVGREDLGSFSEVLLSVCTVRNSYLRLIFNAEMGCDGGVCSHLRNDIARKFGISPNQIVTASNYMRKAQGTLTVGQAIGHQHLSGYGTLGGFSVDLNEKRATHIISNNHVIANSNQANIGDGIFTRDHFPRHIATLQNYTRILFGGHSNYLDLAAATIDSDEGIRVDSLVGHRIPQLGEQVTKVGATTGQTYGTVEALDETVHVRYGNQTATFEDQMVIKGLYGSPFSAPGDSGSFIFGGNGQFIGLLFAGLGDETNANHGVHVIQKLREWKILN